MDTPFIISQGEGKHLPPQWTILNKVRKNIAQQTFKTSTCALVSESTAFLCVLQNLNHFCYYWEVRIYIICYDLCTLCAAFTFSCSHIRSPLIFMLTTRHLMFWPHRTEVFSSQFDHLFIDLFAYLFVYLFTYLFVAFANSAVSNFIWDEINRFLRVLFRERSSVFKCEAGLLRELAFNPRLPMVLLFLKFTSQSHLVWER